MKSRFAFILSIVFLSVLWASTLIYGWPAIYQAGSSRTGELWPNLISELTGVIIELTLIYFIIERFSRLEEAREWNAIRKSVWTLLEKDAQDLGNKVLGSLEKMQACLESAKNHRVSALKTIDNVDHKKIFTVMVSGTSPLPGPDNDIILPISTCRRGILEQLRLCLKHIGFQHNIAKIREQLQTLNVSFTAQSTYLISMYLSKIEKINTEINNLELFLNSEVIRYDLPEYNFNPDEEDSEFIKDNHDFYSYSRTLVIYRDLIRYRNDVEIWIADYDSWGARGFRGHPNWRQLNGAEHDAIENLITVGKLRSSKSPRPGDLFWIDVSSNTYQARPHHQGGRLIVQIKQLKEVRENLSIIYDDPIDWDEVKRGSFLSIEEMADTIRNDLREAKGIVSKIKILSE